MAFFRMCADRIEKIIAKSLATYKKGCIIGGVKISPRPKQDVKPLKQGGINMSHTYTLSGVINGNNVTFNKSFSSRDAAINYMCKYYEQHFVENFQVEEEIEKSKHTIEYVCDYYNRFTVARV